MLFSTPAAPSHGSSAEQPIRVAVVDDDDFVLHALRSYLDESPQIDLLSTFSCGADALAFLRRVPADVVLTDVGMRGMSGIDLLSRLKQEAPSTAVVVLTSLGDDETMMGALRLQANGFLLKSSSPSDIIDAIVCAHSAGTVISPEAASRLVARYLRSAPPARPSDVTKAEEAVLELLCDGMSNAEIAARLTIAESTVKAHVSSLMRKYHVRSRVRLVIAASQTQPPS